MPNKPQNNFLTGDCFSTSFSIRVIRLQQQFKIQPGDLDIIPISKQMSHKHAANQKAYQENEMWYFSYDLLPDNFWMSN